MRQAMGRAEERGRPEGLLARTLGPGSPAAQAEWGWGTNLFGQAGLAPRASPTSTLCTRLSFLPFLPEVGKALGLPQLLPVAPLHLWAEAPEPHGQQSKAKMPQG